jgi:hypothetical protein
MPSPRRTAILVTIASVIAAGCGPYDEGDTTDTSTSEATDSTAVATPRDSPSPASDATDDEGTTQDDSASVSADITPSPDAAHDSDCAAIDIDDPGAFLTFPDPDAARSYDIDNGPVALTVVGCSNTFEANLVYALRNGEGEEPRITGHTMGGTYGGWAEFRFTETLPPGEWTVLVGEDDPSTGERVYYDAVPVTVE